MLRKALGDAGPAVLHVRLWFDGESDSGGCWVR
jgi:hypothetical protein